MLLGIDIGGTTINLGLAQGNQIVRKLCAPSFDQGAQLEETLVHLCEQISRIITPEVSRIGVGVPTLVDPVKGIVYDATNIPSWTVVPLKDRLEAEFECTTSVNNDANCFVLGAAAKLEKPSSVVVGVTLGTGTGIGISIDGKVFNGTNCGAGELASMSYEGGIYEDYCSKKFFSAKGLDPKAIGDKAFAGDPEAMKIFEEFGTHLGHLLSMLLLAYDPGSIVFGGGIAHSFPLFEKAVWASLRESYLYPRFLDNLQITAMPDADIPILGASLL